MNRKYFLSCKALTVILAGLLLCGASGCFGPKTVEKPALAPVFFPPPPDQPKLQFLVSYSGAKDFGGPKSNFIETFLLGAPEYRPDEISKPYGVTIHKGKIYVCDVGQDQIKVLDLNKNKFSTFPAGRGLKNPYNIFIEPDGTKYIADSRGGTVVVYNNDDKLISYLGKDLGIKPMDVLVRGNKLYVTDDNSDQVLILDKISGELLDRLGKQATDEAKIANDEFGLISDIDMDQQGNLYVSDKAKYKVTKLDASGKLMRTYGRYGSLPANLVCAKGIALDRQDRIWVVDAGPAMAVKVYRARDGQFLTYFGTPTSDRPEPGYMYLPAAIHIDYDNVDLFRKYAVDGAQLEFLVLVTNQFGPHKVTVYGFGTFPQTGRQSQPEELQPDADTQPK